MSNTEEQKYDKIVFFYRKTLQKNRDKVRKVKHLVTNTIR